MTVSVVDMSWLMHRYKNALKQLSAEVDGKVIPTGHVYGSLKFIEGLSKESDEVILCLDSHENFRKNECPFYKADRHKKTGDDFFDYDIHQDVENILKLCSQFENVSYVRKAGYEADDLIGSYIRIANKDWRFYFRDDDILQTKGEYNLCVNFEGPLKVGYPVDRKEHIQKKYGVELDYLPLIWKVVKGDPSDNIPAAIPRFPSKYLVEASYNPCYKDNPTFQQCLDSLLKLDYSGKWADFKAQLLDEGSEFCQNLMHNYNVVKPRYTVCEKMRSECTNFEVIYSRYNMKPLKSSGLF